MPFSIEQRREAYKNLSENLRSFFDSNKASEIIEKLSAKYELDPKSFDLIDTEILLANLQLKSTKEALDKMSGEVTLPENKKALLIGEIKSLILNKIDNFSKTNEVPATNNPQNLIEDHEGNLDNVLPKNLPTEHKIGTSLEEKIAPHVGTPGQKLNWEERKKQAGDRIIAENKYGKKDPYREPPTP